VYISVRNSCGGVAIDQAAVCTLRIKGLYSGIERQVLLDQVESGLCWLAIWLDVRVTVTVALVLPLEHHWLGW
jgi:hypothetical protein